MGDYYYYYQHAHDSSPPIVYQMRGNWTQSAMGRLLEIVYNRSLRHFPALAKPTITSLAHQKYGIEDPFRVYSLDPLDIKYISGPPRLYGFLLSGNWDRECRAVNSLDSVRAIEAYFLDENPDPLYKLFKSHVYSLRNSWGYESVLDFENRLNDIKNLYDAINTEGYKSQHELMTEESNVRRKNNEPVPLELNEVTINVGRNGDPLYAGYGSHRLAIARILDVEQIPVIVATRHAENGPDVRFSHYEY